MGARPLIRPALPAVPAWPVLRRRLAIALVVLAALGALYLLWFRDSSLVAVKEVTVTGAEGDPGAETALAQAGVEMTTLHVDQGALWEAVADDPAVVRIDPRPDFPHGLEIAVDLRKPAAYLEADGGTLLAGDGVVLATGSERPAGLPLIDVADPALGGRASGAALALARILGPAPKALARRVQEAGADPRDGPIVTLSGGIELRFGDPSEAAAKWDAAAAVLSSPDFAGAAYIDLSSPARPVAGGG